MGATWVSIAAIVLSALTFAAGQREFARRAKVDYVAGLERRLDDCERDRESFRAEIDELHLTLRRLETGQ